MDPSEAESFHDWCLELVDDGRDRRRAWEGIWWENIATYTGDLWAEWNVHDKKLKESTPASDHRVRLPINLAQPVVRTELAKLTKNRPMLDVLARSQDKTDLNAAEVGDKLLNNYVERKFHMPRVRRRALWWTLTTGLSGILTDFDPNAQEKVRVMVDPKGQPLSDPRVIEAYRQYYRKKHQAPKYEEVPQGELVYRVLSPWQMLWDYSQQFVEDAMWIIVSEVYDIHEAERRWGKEVEPEPDAKPGPIEQRLLGKFDLTSKLAYDKSTSQDMAEIHRLFIKPGHKIFPRGAHVVFTKEEILFRENYPYAHGELPVSVTGHVPLLTGQYPMSVLQQIRGPVLELSRTASQLVENRNLMGNPPWAIPKQLKIDKEIQNKPGLRLEYTHVPNIPPPAPIDMPEIPSYVRELIPQMREHILEISGQGETSQGRVPPGARSGVAIAYLQEEDDTRLGPTVTEFEETMERVGGQTLELIAEKYATSRTITIYHKGSEPEVFDFIGTQLAGNTSVVCQAGSALPRSKAAKQQYILDLWDRKLEQDPRRVREMLELSEGEAEDFEVDLEQAERENRRLQQGEEVEVLEWHNHAAHHYNHRRFMKSADFESLDPGVQQVFIAHDAEHTQLEQLQQQQQMQLQAQAQILGGAGGGGGEGAIAPPGENGQTGEAAPQFSSDLTPRSLTSLEPE